MGDSYRVKVTCAHLELQNDADFLVFDNDLMTAEHEGLSHIMPGEVYFGGRKMNSRI